MKNSLNRRKKRIILFVFFTVTALICLFIILKIYMANELKRQDYKRIASTQYDTVFLSMYPIDTYQEEDYSHFRAMTLFKAAYCIPSLSTLTDYMRHIADSGNLVTTAYLGIRPELTDPIKLEELLAAYPGITWEIVLPYPSADYWQSLSQKDYEQTLTSFQNFLTAVPDIPEANFYFFGTQEWLIANPANYLDHMSVTEDTATILMTNSDIAHSFLVTTENAAAYAETLETLTDTLRTAPRTYPDLSDHCIVFFGDSVIGNYTDNTSIPGVVAALTGAEIYNCGYGGGTASQSPDNLISLPGITDAFFRKDPSAFPEDSQPYIGISSYLKSASSDKQICFVINYGLNDYFSEYPIASEDPYDIATYSGAVRTAVSLIRENVPDAQIILCTPNFSAAFENGTEPHGTDGSVLEDYANAILSLSQELQTDVLDNYHNLGITAENHNQYLADRIHPNYACRFLIGSNLCHMIH